MTLFSYKYLWPWLSLPDIVQKRVITSLNLPPKFDRLTIGEADTHIRRKAPNTRALRTILFFLQSLTKLFGIVQAGVSIRFDRYASALPLNTAMRSIDKMNGASKYRHVRPRTQHATIIFKNKTDYADVGLWEKLYAFGTCVIRVLI